MIKIQGTIVEPGTIYSQHSLGNIERKTLDILASSSHVYTYDSVETLLFELRLRRSIVDASIALYRSNFSFRVFRKSKCNPEYWDRTEEGGFRLRSGAVPSKAVRDIYVNSSKYGTECSTAIVIIYYMAILDVFPQELFDRVFKHIYLMNWQHLDSTLGIVHLRNLPDYFPGDCRYFKNPDVDPLTPQWQGENAIDLGNGTYYGHGIGIGNKDFFITQLNKNRKEGSQVSAYLMDSATFPGFKSLSRIYNSFTSSVQP